MRVVLYAARLRAVRRRGAHRVALNWSACSPLLTATAEGRFFRALSQYGRGMIPREDVHTVVLQPETELLRSNGLMEVKRIGILRARMCTSHFPAYRCLCVPVGTLFPAAAHTRYVCLPFFHVSRVCSNIERWWRGLTWRTSRRLHKPCNEMYYFLCFRLFSAKRKTSNENGI